MAEQRTRARAAWAGTGDAATERVWFDLRESLGATEFLGYATEVAEGEILGLVAEGAALTEAGPGTPVSVILNQTPFYAESGGQVGDAGRITGPDGLMIRVDDTQKKLGDLFVHIGTVEAGTARVGHPRPGQRGPRTARRHPKPPQRHAPAACGTPPPPGGPCDTEGQPERARPAALRRQPAHAHQPRGPGCRGGRGERRDSWQHRGHDPPHDARGGGRRGRHGAVRREVRGRGPRRVHGHTTRRWPGVFGGAVRWHACWAHRRHRPVPGGQRRRRQRRRPPDRGRDRRHGEWTR